MDKLTDNDATMQLKTRNILFLFSDTQPSPADGTPGRTSAEPATNEHALDKQTSGNQASDDQGNAKPTTVESSGPNNVSGDQGQPDSAMGDRVSSEHVATDKPTVDQVDKDDVSHHDVCTDRMSMGGIKASMERSMQTEDEKALLVPSLEVRNRWLFL